MSLTAEQLELRRTGIGGSEVAAVLGLSPWMRPIDVWRAKVEGYSVPENAVMKRGRILEPAVAQFFAEETGAKLRESTTLRHPSLSWVLATPDRIATWPDGSDTLVELKTASLSMRTEWGEPGTDEVPQQYLLQVAWTMAVTGLSLAHVGVLIGGDEFRVYRLERDLELEAVLIERVGEWWERHVLREEPPELDGSDSTSRWLVSRYPRDTAPLLDATPEVDEIFSRLCAAELAEETAKRDADFARNELKALIGSASGIQGAGWRATWKANKRGVRSFRRTFLNEE